MPGTIQLLDYQKSVIMANRICVKAKSAWKKVKLDTTAFSQSDVDGVVCFEELTDYEILSQNDAKVKKKRKNRDSHAIELIQQKDHTLKKKKDATCTEDEKCKVVKKKKTISQISPNNLEANIDAVNVGKASVIKERKEHKQGNVFVREKIVKEELNETLEDIPTKVEKKTSKRQLKRKRKNDSFSQEVLSAKKMKKDSAHSEDGITNDSEIKGHSLEGMDAWNNMFVPEEILWALKEQGFTEPTPIQTQVLPSAIRDKMDIVGAAETGSGKTLAFGIPVLHFILQQKQALQDDVQMESDDACDTGDREDEDIFVDELVSEDSPDNNSTDKDSSPEDVIHDNGIGCVKVIKDVDFSWMDKNETVDKGSAGTYPMALILEPTRELAIQVKNHLLAAAKYTDIKGELFLSEIEKTPHVVVDEADRMIEKGHYEELAKLLERMKRDQTQQHRHTYVFSATLTMVHQGPKRVMKKKKKNFNEKQKLVYLMRKIGLKPKPKVVDITTKIGTVETLTEARIHCTREEKDIYLYYFLKQYPGRTLVFTNSKDCIRRLVSIFTLLQCNPLPLHADMHQKQRLKNLERFSSNPRSLLIASDVAARGLDIPNVQHVVHYQVPFTVENYVHRSGRTARAQKEGLSVMIIGPDDLKNYHKIIHTINKGEDLPLFPVNQEYIPELKYRVNLVRKLETQEYRMNKTKRQNDWFKKAADEIGVDIEDEGLLNNTRDDAENAQHHRYIKHMKYELSSLLQQPIEIRGMRCKYPTMSGKLVAPEPTDVEPDAIKSVKKSRKADKLVKSNQSVVPEKNPRKRQSKWKKNKNASGKDKDM